MSLNTTLCFKSLFVVHFSLSTMDHSAFYLQNFYIYFIHNDNHFIKIMVVFFFFLVVNKV